MKHTILAAILSVITLSAYAGTNPVSKMNGFECGVQVGKSISNLAGTAAAQEAGYLSEDMTNYIAQTKLSVTLKRKADKSQAAQAANNSWQAIVSDLKQIKSASADEAQAIFKACGLEFLNE